MQPSLVILAAGMASRFGSMKQVEGFGPYGETIMDFSIYDAIQIGYKKIIFIIKEEFLSVFKENITHKWATKIEIDFVFQSLDKFIEPFELPAARVKPWGTGHALLCCIDTIKAPFAIINADDFYGKNALQAAYNFLVQEVSDTQFAIIGYPLKNTLSDNGTVNRGVCSIDNENNLIDITERINISKQKDGSIGYFDENQVWNTLSPDTMVSMNFFAFSPAVIQHAKTLFTPFLEAKRMELKSEFFIPAIVDDFVKTQKGKVKIIPTSSNWFGVTYKEDTPSVKAMIAALIAQKSYPAPLWKA